MKHPMIMLVLSLAGVLFSGYLSGVKFFSETCAFNESCPYFLGYPTCYYGFALFLVLFVVSVLGVMEKMLMPRVTKWQVWTSAAGVVFAGYFSVPEIVNLVSTGEFSALGLPTCVYGAIFFVLIFFLALRHQRSEGTEAAAIEPGDEYRT